MKKEKKLILICNSHLDPVWLWEWEEGLAETITTFRTAAEFCEERESFVFCHNESLLYQWLLEYDPPLFQRIRDLVDKGLWNLMGGWYVQPDCNLLSGESFVRQILSGKGFFKKHFNYEPKTAVNMDPFGHTRGLVQILCKAGYDSYLFCRPDPGCLELPGDDFVWEGYDGSQIMAHRAPDHYNSQRGKAAEKITKWLDDHNDRDTGILLWGIGNHGGGPSRKDLDDISKLQKTNRDWAILHGSPEEYFKLLDKEDLPRVDFGLNPFAVGCYTSMSKLKRRHRQLENLLFSTEKMVAEASLQGLMKYPFNKFQEAQDDILFCQFHDILPGSGIQEVEKDALQKLGHSAEILRRLRTKAFFSLASGQEPAQKEEFPIMVYNHHPYNLETTVTVEFQPPEPNFDSKALLVPRLTDKKGKLLEYQIEKESCNIQADQRKRISFKAVLQASAINRFSCYLDVVPKAKLSVSSSYKGEFIFKTEDLELLINRKTGLVDKFCVKGINYLKPGSFELKVIKDNPDPWGMKVNSFKKPAREFTLMSAVQSAEFAGVLSNELEPLRVITDGPVRTIVEALFQYNNSTLCLRYYIPKKGNELEISIRVYWNEKDRMLKLKLPTQFTKGKCRGQVAYGVEKFVRYSEELLAQKWIGICSEDKKNAITVINDSTYGFDYADGELNMSLLRSPAYAGHPVENKNNIVLQDRFEQRIDQGERLFRFWIKAGEADERFDKIGREASLHNEQPMALVCYPAPKKVKVTSGITLADEVIELTAMKISEDRKRLIIRLFEPSGMKRKTNVTIPFFKINFEVSLGAFEIKTFAVVLKSGKIKEVNLLEETLGVIKS